MREDLNQQADFLPVSFSIGQQKRRLSTKKDERTFNGAMTSAQAAILLSLKKPIFQQLS